MTPPKLDYITSYSGNIIHVLKPDPREIFADDIAQGLSNMCRYGGQCDPSYSVAQHSVYVSLLLPDEGDLQLRGLLHDASEGLGLVDIPTPVKHSGLMEGYRQLEKAMMDAVYTRFGLDLVDPPELKVVDKLVLKQEQFCLRNRGKDKPFPFDIKPWTPKRSKREWLKRFNELYKGE